MRNLSRLTLSVFLSCFVVYGAQQISLFGNVKDSTGMPVDSAVVSLLVAGVRTFTNSSGSYSLTGIIPSSAARNQAGRTIGSIPRFAGKVLFLELAEETKLEISVCDIRGKIVARVYDGIAQAGNHALSPVNGIRTPGAYVIQCRVGGQIFCYKYICSRIDAAHTTPAPVLRKQTGSRTLAKAAAAVDLLNVTKPGYIGTSIPVEAYSGMLPDVTLVVSTSARTKEIDQNVKYGGVLACTVEPGLSIKDSVPEKLWISEGDTFVCTGTEYSLTRTPSQFAAVNPNADILWPGALVQGKSLKDGILSPIPVNRSPGTITLTLATGGSKPYFRDIPAPSLSSATQAINDILSEFTSKTPAFFSYEYSQVYSTQHLSIAIHANVEGGQWSGGGSLNFDSKNYKNRILVQFTQQYFTMAFNPPSGPSGVFAPTVTAADLAPYVGAGNPPCYIASVTYGRLFYLLFESKSSMMDLEAAVNATFNVKAAKVDTQDSLKFNNTLRETTIKSYGIGGNAADAIKAATGNTIGDTTVSQFDMIKQFFASSANFDSASPGVPISYTVRHLSDASQVKLAMTTEYTASECVPGCKDGAKDTCGICNGNGSTCGLCSDSTITYTHECPEGVFVSFFLPAAGNGTVVSGWKDGCFTRFNFGQRTINWKGAAFKCESGAWKKTQGAISYEFQAGPLNQTQENPKLNAGNCQ